MMNDKLVSMSVNGLSRVKHVVAKLVASSQWCELIPLSDSADIYEIRVKIDCGGLLQQAITDSYYAHPVGYIPTPPGDFTDLPNPDLSGSPYDIVE